MGRRNRERRMAKQKQGRRSAADREHRRSDIGPDRAHIIENLVIAMSTAASSPGAGSAVELVEQCHGFERELDVAADLVVHEAIRAAWEYGWSPTDLHEIARRRLDAAGVRYLDEAIMLESQRYSAASLHPRRRAELLRRSVADGPDRHVGCRQTASVGDLTADTEVREQNSPLRGTRGHKNVGRLHIAVKQTPLMCKIQGVGDRINDHHDVYDRHRHRAGEEVIHHHQRGAIETCWKRGYFKDLAGAAAMRFGGHAARTLSL